MVTFVQATFVSATFVHSRNISAVTDQIFTRFFSPNFLQTLIFLDPKICGPTIFRTTFLPSSASTQLNFNFNWGWDSLISIFRHPPTHLATRKSTTTNSMSSISQLLLTGFWPNFKNRFLEPSWTDFNCYGDICSGHICPGDICPYQEYLSWYWPDFDQTLKVGSWDHL